MSKKDFARKMVTTQRLADSKLSKATVESIVSQVDACNGAGTVSIPAGQLAFLLVEHGRNLAVLEQWKAIGI